MNYITIKGAPEISRKLRQLEAKVGRKVIRKAFRAALKPMAADIKSSEPMGETGTLRKAVKVRAGKGGKGKISTIIIISKKAFKGRWYGSFRDLGTRKMAGSDAMRAGFGRKAEATKASAEQGILDGIEAEVKA